jgi:hypothetical protein
MMRTSGNRQKHEDEKIRCVRLDTVQFRDEVYEGGEWGEAPLSAGAQKVN